MGKCKTLKIFFQKKRFYFSFSLPANQPPIPKPIPYKNARITRPYPDTSISTLTRGLEKGELNVKQTPGKDSPNELGMNSVTTPFEARSRARVKRN